MNHLTSIHVIMTPPPHAQGGFLHTSSLHPVIRCYMRQAKDSDVVHCLVNMISGQTQVYCAEVIA